MLAVRNNPRNAPTQRPPRDVQLAPASYLPPSGNTFVTTVTTTRECPDPLDPCKPRGFSTETAQVFQTPATPQVPQLREQAVQCVCGNTFMDDAVFCPRCGSKRPPTLLIEGDRQGPASTFSNAYGQGQAALVAETCRFNADEQLRLIRLRQRLSGCLEEFKGLSLLLGAGAAENESGLPRLREAHRSRLNGTTYTVEDAQRELMPDRMVEKMTGYLNFVDGALADTIDLPAGGADAVRQAVLTVEADPTSRPFSPPCAGAPSAEAQALATDAARQSPAVDPTSNVVGSAGYAQEQTQWRQRAPEIPFAPMRQMKPFAI